MDEVFPSADEIRERAQRASERPAVWRETNLRIAREFVAKMTDAGIEAPRATDGSGEVGWETPTGDTLLAPGSPPFWWRISSYGGAFDLYNTKTYVFTRVALEDLPDLTRWEPTRLRDYLARQIPT
jgi:hypothetical protein